MFFIITLLTAASLFAQNEAKADVAFHNFPWGTGEKEFTAKVGKPAQVEEYNGIKSLLYDNIEVSGFRVFMLAYFSKDGLEGGVYYFNTSSLDELMRCYTTMQNELLEKFGSTPTCIPIYKEKFFYISSWDLRTGYIQLKVDTRKNEPVALWYSSPALTKKMFGS